MSVDTESSPQNFLSSPIVRILGLIIALLVIIGIVIYLLLRQFNPLIITPFQNFEPEITVGQNLTVKVDHIHLQSLPIAYDIQPIPLPDNARFDRQTGELYFQPGIAQQGTYNIVITLTDGEEEVSQPITITVNPPPDDGVTVVTGRILDANESADGNEVPIVGATITHMESGMSTTTGSDGRFELREIPAGIGHLDFDASTADPEGTYGGYRAKKNIINGIVNNIERDIYIMKIDTEGTVEIILGESATIDNPNLDIQLEIPANTVVDDAGEDFSGTLSVSDVPADFTPASLPGDLNPAQVITVQPMGLTFNQPAPITFPNNEGLPAGSEVNLWSLDHDTGEFFIAGTGRVSSDGEDIVTISGGIRESSWHFPLPPSGRNNQPDDKPQSHDDPPQHCPASTVTLTDGRLGTDITLPSYINLGEERFVQLMYRTDRAFPKTILPVQTTIERRAAVPPLVSFGVNIGGVNQDVNYFVDTSTLSESRDETIRTGLVIDNANLETGIYPFTVAQTSHYSASSLTSRLFERFTVVNEVNSPYGAGWSIADLMNIVETSNGDILLIDGDGTSTIYSPRPFDLNLWTREGQGNGIWSVSDDGLFVEQTRNSDQPTFFVSPDNYIDTTISGRFTVDTRSDDDFIGFVIGYRSPLDENGDAGNDMQFVVFDWKKQDQNLSGNEGLEGFNLRQIDGEIENPDDVFWSRTDAPGITVLASDYGPEKGWEEFVEYEFELIYERDRIRIFIDDRPIFDVAGEFEEGRFGFYGYSQANTIYRDFRTNQEISIFSAPDGAYATIARNDDGTFTLSYPDGMHVEFDANGLQTSRIDRNGNTTTYSYQDNRLSTITDPTGGETTFSYADGLLQSIVDPTGRETTFDHNEARDLIGVTYPDGSSQSFTYDNNHLMVSETDRREEVTQRTYDASGRFISAILRDGSENTTQNAISFGLMDTTDGLGDEDNPSTAVDADETQTIITDGEGRTIQFEFGSQGYPSEIIGPANERIQIQRDADGNPTRVVSPNNNVYNMTYNSHGNLLSFYDATIRGTTQFTYEPIYQQVQTIVDANGRTTRFEHDEFGNMIDMSSPMGREWTYTYNDRGQVATSADATGLVTEYSYDENGNLTQIVDGDDERITSVNYTDEGYVETLTDAEGHTYSFTYDSMGNLLTETLPDDSVIEYGYDDNDNLTSVTVPAGDVHTFAHSPLDLVTSYDPPGDDDATTYTYNDAQDVIQMALPDDRAVDYRYNDDGQLTEIETSRGITELSYFNSGYLRYITTPENNRLSYIYDEDLLYRFIWSGEVTGDVRWQYDRLYQVTRQYLNGDRLDFAYNNDYQLTRAGALTLDYDNTSGLLTETRVGNISDEYEFNSFSELTYYVAMIDGDDVYDVSYTRDKLGRITELQETISGTTVSYAYEYDTRGQLIRVTRDDALIATYTYDANGNRLSHNPDDTTPIASYDVDDRLLEYDGVTYTYLGNGDLSTKNTDEGETQYTYDELGSLMQVILPDGTQIDYIIDGENRRIGKVVDGEQMQGFLYEDELNPVAELDGNNNVVSRFVYGAEINVPAYMIRDDIEYRIISDHLGSIRLVINTSSGEIVQQIDYDAWGNVLTDTNPGFQPFGFAGGLYDSDTGLVRFGARDYDPAIGRWTTKDPIGFASDDTNMYGYVANNPINRIDILGLRALRVPPANRSPFPINRGPNRRRNPFHPKSGPKAELFQRLSDYLDAKYGPMRQLQDNMTRYLQELREIERMNKEAEERRKYPRCTAENPTGADAILTNPKPMIPNAARPTPNLGILPGINNNYFNGNDILFQIDGR